MMKLTTPRRRLLLTLSCLFALLAATYGCSSDPSDESSDNGSGGQNPSGGAASGGAASGGDGSGGSASGGEVGSGGDASGGMGGDGSGGDGSGGDGSGGVPAVGGSTSTDLPELLSETGLYSDILTGELAPGVREFEPLFRLWTDGADKKRWIYLPEGEQIDTSDMDNWQYPVGTRLWKEFSRDGVRVETRLITRVRTGGRGWKGVAYIWNSENNAEQTDATATPDGLSNALGTEHDVPAQSACTDCHGDRPDWPLGVSAVLMSHDGPGLTMDSLIADNLLTVPPSGPFVVPGDETERAALGYLHVNCGPCHRLEATGEDRSGGMMTWLMTAQLGSVEETDTFATIVNQGIGSADGIEPLPYRIYGGDPDQSELIRRISIRGTDDQMPPMGTEIVDPDIQLVRDWIATLSPPD